ncbi:MAG: galactose oxidase-like domain-containing protein [Candidatus Acidiferrales bacterium]
MWSSTEEHETDWTTDHNLYLWDPKTDSFRLLERPGYEIFCAGHTLLADGQVLVVGGHVTGMVGSPRASLFNPFRESWTSLPDMAAGRWYPTATALPTGEALALSGALNETAVNRLPEVWQPARSSWRPLSTALHSQYLYPWMFVVPNGKVFYAGPTVASRFLDVSGTGAWSSPLFSHFVGPRLEGSAVLYEPGKVLIVGGGDPPTASAEVIDLTSASPFWRNVAPLTQPRLYLNATLLPDGTVLVTGGTTATEPDEAELAVRQPELWSPVSETWTTLASNAVYRGYHSVALLLPDGRVLSTGGDHNATHPTAEFFSPPYLFKGPQPTIASVRKAVTYGQTFFVRTPEAGDIAQVTWIRLPAVTHSFDQNQGINFLTFSATEQGVNVTAPADPNLSPPGHYMLFLLNDQSVPSVATIVRIEAATGNAPARPLDLLTATLAEGEVELDWTDNSSDEEGFLVERSFDGITFVEIAALSANATAYSDSGLAPCAAYSYRVRAYNLAGESSYSNSATTTTLAAAGDFCLAVSPGVPTSASIHAGETATFYLTLVPGGNPLSVELACPSLPPGARCLFSPATASVDAQAAAQVTLEVATEARSLLGPIQRAPNGNWQAVPNLLPFLLVLMFALTAATVRRFARLRARPALWLAILWLCLSSLSCGSGATTVTTVTVKGTPSGLHTLRVTASTAGQTKEVTLILRVN